jgi:hypothetical protein
VVGPRHEDADHGWLVGVEVPADEELIECAGGEEIGTVGRVGGDSGINQMLGWVAEDGIVDGEGVAINE